MRVAVQISGQQRYGEFFPHFAESMNVFGSVDFFFHHWDGPRTNDEISALVPTNHAVRAIKSEPQIEFQINPEWKMLIPVGSSIFNLVSMTYGIQEANKLRLEYEKAAGAEYDLVIRARPDIRLVDFPSDSTWLAQMPERTVFVGKRPHYLPAHKPEIQDQVAIGRADTMNIYSGLFGALDRFHAEGRKFHPETYFHWWLSSNGIAMNETVFSPEMEKVKIRREDRAVY